VFNKSDSDGVLLFGLAEVEFAILVGYWQVSESAQQARNHLDGFGRLVHKQALVVHEVADLGLVVTFQEKHDLEQETESLL
jgi:hypothetical protein